MSHDQVKSTVGLVKYQDPEKGEVTSNCIHYGKGFLIVPGTALKSRASIDSATFQFGSKKFSATGGRSFFHNHIPVIDVDKVPGLFVLTQIKLGRFFETGTYERDWENWERDEKKNLPPSLSEIPGISTDNTLKTGTYITILHHNTTGELKSSNSTITQIADSSVVYNADLGENSSGGLVTTEKGELVGIHFNEGNKGVCLVWQRIKQIVDNRNEICTALHAVAFRKVSPNRAKDGITRALEYCRKYDVELYVPIPKELCDSNDNLPSVISWPVQQVQASSVENHEHSSTDNIKIKEKEKEEEEEKKKKQDEEERKENEKKVIKEEEDSRQRRGG